MDVAFIPIWFINIFVKKQIIKHEINVLFSNILILLTFLIFKKSVIDFINLIPHFCIFDKIIGVECPVCGITRAFSEISSGNLVDAYRYNVSSIFIFIYLIVQIILRIITLKNNNLIQQINHLSKVSSYFIIGLIAINWIIKLLRTTIM